MRRPVVDMMAKLFKVREGGISIKKISNFLLNMLILNENRYKIASSKVFVQSKY